MKKIELNIPESSEVKDKAARTMAGLAKKTKEVMNAPEVTEAKEDIKEAAKAVRTKVSEVNLEFYTDEGDKAAISVSEIEKAVKKEALKKGLKGDIKIYLNMNEMAAYYTVDGDGDESNSVKFEDIYG